MFLSNGASKVSHWLFTLGCVLYTGTLHSFHKTERENSFSILRKPQMLPWSIIKVKYDFLQSQANTAAAYPPLTTPATDWGILIKFRFQSSFPWPSTTIISQIKQLVISSTVWWAQALKDLCRRLSRQALSVSLRMAPWPVRHKIITCCGPVPRLCNDFPFFCPPCSPSSPRGWREGSSLPKLLHPHDPCESAEMSLVLILITSVSLWEDRVLEEKQGNFHKFRRNHAQCYAEVKQQGKGCPSDTPLNKLCHWSSSLTFWKRRLWFRTMPLPTAGVRAGPRGLKRKFFKLS